MACDQQATHGENYKFKIKTKIGAIYNPLIHPKPFLVGWCGNLEAAQNMMNYMSSYDGTGKKPKSRDCEYLVLTEDRKIYTFVDPHNWVSINEGYYSIGSGSRYALGALNAGASPKDAIKAAMKCDPMTGIGVKVVSIK